VTLCRFVDRINVPEEPAVSMVTVKEVEGSSKKLLPTY
jgi:hypothetical protein